MQPPVIPAALPDDEVEPLLAAAVWIFHPLDELGRHVNDSRPHNEYSLRMCCDICSPMPPREESFELHDLRLFSLPGGKGIG